MGDCGSIIVKSFSCKLTVNIIQASWLAEPFFFPEFLDNAFAGFGAGWWRLALGCLCELGIFESVGDGCEDAVNGGLDLVFL